MDTQLIHQYSDVLCSLIHGSNLQFVLRRVRPMSAQLQILIIDRYTQTIKTTIHTMMFEGVSKDDVNYHLLLNVQSWELILMYPNGIICVYQNIFRRKTTLKEVIQSDYMSILGPQIVKEQLVFLSQPKNGPLLLVQINMENFTAEITQKRQMSAKDCCILKLGEMLKEPAPKITDFCCDGDLVFVAIKTGQICVMSFSQSRVNRNFSIQSAFSKSEIYQRAVVEAELFQDPPAKSVTCLDFITSQSDSILGLLVVGDSLGFIYVIQLAKIPGCSDTLLYMGYQESPIISAKWIANLDLKFAVMTSSGDLSIYDVILDTDDAVADSVQATRIHQILSFEELNQGFQLCEVGMLGSQCIQVDRGLELMPEKLSILWPSRILRKHEIGAGQNQDIIITQQCLHQFSIVASTYPLVRDMVFTSALSSNGGNFMHQMSLEQLIPKVSDDQLECPREYENVFYLDKEQNICIFSNVTGKDSKLCSIKEYVQSGPQKIIFTDIQIRQDFQKGMIKFLISWMNPQSSSTFKKFLFTWISYDMTKGTILKEQSNRDPPKQGLYPKFLVGNEDIVCLDHDCSMGSVAQTSKLKIFTFDPFLDTREVNLMQKVQHLYTTPLRNGKVLLFYNISENLIQFSKSRSEQKYGEDDLQIYQNRKYSFKLAYDEKVTDIRWYGFSGRQEKLNPKAVIISNQRIYIVDKNLSIMQNYSLMRNKLIVKSLSIIANTILFTTDHHLYYLTQEKGQTASNDTVPEAVLPCAPIMSFNNCILVGALSDRVILCQNSRFIVRAVPLLEPLLLGYLASFSSAKVKQEIDIDLVQRACKYLDTNQISQNLTRKLRQLEMVNTQIFIFSNQNAIQFDIQSKIHTLEANLVQEKQKQQQFFECLFPNKDINLDSEEVAPSVLEDRNDIILKLQNDPSYCGEREILRQKLQFLKDRYLPKKDPSAIRFAFEIAELLQDWQSVLVFLHDEFLTKFNNILKENNHQNRYEIMLEYLANQKQVFEIKNQRPQTWIKNINQLFKQEVNLLDMLSVPKKELQNPVVDKPIFRINLAYGECSFSYFCGNKYLGSVVSQTFGNWLGYESMIAQQGEIQSGVKDFNLQKEKKVEKIEVQEEDDVKSDTAADDLDEKTSILGYFRLDEGSGPFLDISDNKFTSPEQTWCDILEESEPIEYEDKWGKTNQPSYSVKIKNFEITGIPQYGNFSVEFWGRNSQKLAICGHPVPGEKCWTHYCLSMSIRNGLKLYKNAEEIKREPGTKLKLANVIINGEIEITELRIWKIALNQGIISENYKMPLAMLHEQKRKIKIDINKKKKGGGLGGLGGMKGNFNTNNKLAGMSKLAKKVEFNETQKIYQTNIQQIFPSEPIQPEPLKVQPTLQNLPDPVLLQIDPKIKPIQKVETDFFAFEQPDFNKTQRFNPKSSTLFEKPQDPVLIIETEVKSPPKYQLTSKTATQKQKLKELNEQRDQKINLLQKLEQEFQQTEVFTCIDDYFADIIELILTLELPQTEPVFQSLISHMNKHQQLITYIGFKHLLSTISLLRYLIHIMEKVQNIIDNDRESVILKGSLTLLFIEIMPKLKNLPMGPILFQKLLQLAMMCNLEALQYATLEKIVKFVEKFEPLQAVKPDEEFEKVLSLAKQALDSDTSSDANIWSQNLNYGHLTLEKTDSGKKGHIQPYCPQCLSDLTFGHAQPQCFQCFAQVAVCQNSLEICLNDGSFLTKCELCSSQFSKGFLQVIKKPDDYNQVQCPTCLIQYIDLA